MKQLLRIFKISLFATSLLASSLIIAAPLAPATAAPANPTIPASTPSTTNSQNASAPVNPSENPYVDKATAEASSAVANAWLKLLDGGQYSESWKQGSLLLQKTMSEKEWDIFLTTVRKPLGNVKERKLVQQLPAKDPKGLPPGDYMVMLYETSFSTKDSAKELVTMHHGNDGKWRIVTYLVSQ